MVIANNIIDVAIVDDDRLLLRELNRLFDETSSVNLRWSGDDYLYFLNSVIHRIDVVLLDIMLGDKSGTELIELIKEKNPRIQIIMFTVVEDGCVIIDCIKKGADGYLLKDSSFDQIIASITTTYKGGSNLSPMIARKLINYFSSNKSDYLKWGEILNDMEYQVLKLLSDGNSYKIIADRLDMSLDSVRYHIKSLYKKLEVNSKGEAIKMYLQA